MIEQGVRQQADDVACKAETCGGCGTPGRPTEAAEARGAETRVGMTQWCEPKRSCPKRRAAFFPSVPMARD
jgi:hypothetical protein